MFYTLPSARQNYNDDDDDDNNNNNNKLEGSDQNKQER
jgi:hypothetical protein